MNTQFMSNILSTSSPCTFQELGELFNTLYQCWYSHPKHFGFQAFDEFLKSLPITYYSYYQCVQQMQQYQLSAATQPPSPPSSAASTPEIQENQPLSPPQPEPEPVPEPQPNPEPEPVSQPEPEPEPVSPPQMVQTNRIRHKRCSIAPALEPIEEDEPLTSSPSSTPSHSPNASPSPCPNEKLNACAPIFVPGDNSSSNESPKKYKKQPFEPKHAARAKLNIYIPKHMTKTLLAAIAESFPNTGTLYYYLDISTALQINDKQMEIIHTPNGQNIVIVNFDLHRKNTNELLYAVVIPNDVDRIQDSTKWLWKIDEFMSAEEIICKYQIDAADLPKSSRSMKNGLYHKFKSQLQQIHEINDMEILRNYKWTNNEMKQIGSSQKTKKGKKPQEVKVVLNEQFWIHQCQNSWSYLPAVPIVVYENREINQHWLEWVKMVYVQSEDAFIGVSFKYDENENKFQIESLCLDKGDIHNKHRLIGLARNHSEDVLNSDYDEYFDRFNTRITEVEWR